MALEYRVVATTERSWFRWKRKRRKAERYKPEPRSFGKFRIL
jgi:hypothetical protein